MCFYNEGADWFAAVTTHEVKNVLYHRVPVRCCECGGIMPLGAKMHCVNMREYEECRECDGSDSECEHDFGETYSCHWCESCEKLLTAIEAVEADEGCPENARRPLHEGLHESLVEHSERDKYAERALLMFPELAGHRLLRWYWQPEEEE